MVKFCKSPKCLVGKTVIITGANSGIGYETTLEFAKRGCRVIMVCKTPELGYPAKELIIKETENEDVVLKILNLEDLSAVRKFANEMNETETRLDFLINNAGVLSCPDKKTKDDLPSLMVINYFAPFLLTNLLLDLLKKSAPSRVVNVASIAAKWVSLDLKNLNKHTFFLMYCRSKLCLIYFTQELGKILKDSGVTAYSVHPGCVATNITGFGSVILWAMRKILKSPKQGAQTTIYTCLEDGLEEYSGEHFDDCQPVENYSSAADDEVRVKLWETTKNMLSLF